MHQRMASSAASIGCGSGGEGSGTKRGFEHVGFEDDDDDNDNDNDKDCDDANQPPPPTASTATSNLATDPTSNNFQPRRKRTKEHSEFVTKLFEAIENRKHFDLIRWTPNGDSFVVVDTNQFAKTVLPVIFKHSNFQSFVRQLNKYDFKKVRTTDEAKLMYGETSSEFQHTCFRHGQEHLLSEIKRKPAAASNVKSEGVHDITAANAPTPDEHACIPKKSPPMYNHQYYSSHHQLPSFPSHIQDARLPPLPPPSYLQQTTTISQVESKIREISAAEHETQQRLQQARSEHANLKQDLAHYRRIIQWQDQVFEQFERTRVSGFSRQSKINLLHSLRNNLPPGMSPLPQIPPNGGLEVLKSHIKLALEFVDTNLEARRPMPPFHNGRYDGFGNGEGMFRR